MQVLEKVERDTKEGRRRAERERLEKEKSMQRKRAQLKEAFLRQQVEALRASKSTIK
jgi:hypothetical protein